MASDANHDASMLPRPAMSQPTGARASRLTPLQRSGDSEWGTPVTARSHADVRAELLAQATPTAPAVAPAQESGATSPTPLPGAEHQRAGSNASRHSTDDVPTVTARPASRADRMKSGLAQAGAYMSRRITSRRHLISPEVGDPSAAGAPASGAATVAPVLRSRAIPAVIHMQLLDNIRLLDILKVVVAVLGVFTFVTFVLAVYDMAPGSVTSANLAAGSVVSSTISTGAVSGVHLAAASVSSTKLGVGSVTSDKLSAFAVVSGVLADSSVTSRALGEGATTTGTTAHTEPCLSVI